uniref:leukotriene C4 synthase isoform X5 n=1 Tax=Callithrix jacchus TaxID=9483 RepID=UPI0023DD27B7|nr:leukotriene C4 synthase isoform X5 [Callithrix jacchus]
MRLGKEGAGSGEAVPSWLLSPAQALVSSLPAWPGSLWYGHAPRTPSTETGRGDTQAALPLLGRSLSSSRGSALPSSPLHTARATADTSIMKDEVALLATVTLLGVLLQAYFSLQGELQRVLPAVPRHALGRRHLLSRRATRAPRTSEAGPSRATARLTAARRLAPLYVSARALWLLVALAALGLLSHFLPAALCAALLERLQTLLPWA